MPQLEKSSVCPIDSGFLDQGEKLRLASGSSDRIRSLGKRLGMVSF